MQKICNDSKMNATLKIFVEGRQLISYSFILFSTFISVESLVENISVKLKGSRRINLF
jgi:hypothetical protein